MSVTVLSAEPSQILVRSSVMMEKFDLESEFRASVVRVESVCVESWQPEIDVVGLDFKIEKKELLNSVMMVHKYWASILQAAKSSAILNRRTTIQEVDLKKASEAVTNSAQVFFSSAITCKY